MCSTDSIIRCARPNDLPLSTLTKSSHAICTSTTPTRKTNGGTRGVIVFSTTHMPTKCFQKAGKRKMVSHGHGIYNLFLLWSEKQPLHFPHKFSQNIVNCSVPSQYEKLFICRYPLAVTRHKDSEATSSSIYAQHNPWKPTVSFEDYISDNEDIVNQVYP